MPEYISPDCVMQDCIMPAAGASSRMRSPGSEEDFKPLLRFGETTIAETAATAALGAGCRLILVVGHRGDEVAAHFGAARYRDPLEAGRLLVVRNPRWSEGLLTSIQAALPSVAGEAFFISHADMPFVSPDDYRALAKARLELADPLTAIFATYEGARGHPVLLPSAWIPGILPLDPRGRLKDFLASRPSIAVETGPGALRDIDTPEDYCSAVPAAI